VAACGIPVWGSSRGGRLARRLDWDAAHEPALTQGRRKTVGEGCGLEQGVAGRSEDSDGPSEVLESLEEVFS